MNITIHLLGKVCSYWEAVRLILVHIGFPKCPSCIISNMLSVFSFTWQTLSFIFDSVYSRYPNLNKHFKSKSGIPQKKQQQKQLAWRQPWYFGMPELCVHTPLSSDRILKRYIFKCQALIQCIILLHQRWSLVNLAFVDCECVVVKMKWLLL